MPLGLLTVRATAIFGSVAVGRPFGGRGGVTEGGPECGGSTGNTGGIIPGAVIGGVGTAPGVGNG